MLIYFDPNLSFASIQKRSNNSINYPDKIVSTLIAANIFKASLGIFIFIQHMIKSVMPGKLINRFFYYKRHIYVLFTIFNVQITKPHIFSDLLVSPVNLLSLSLSLSSLTFKTPANRELLRETNREQKGAAVS